MSNPYVSIIIPVYNEEKYLDRCLSSVIAQSFTDIEIILVDDFSIDNSGKIIEEYLSLDKRIILIEHETNKGQGEARNAGIRKSCGEYIYFLDSDDYLPENAIETLCNIAKEYDDDIIYGKTKSEINVDGMYIREELRNVNLIIYPALLYNHSVWNKLLKRSFVLNNNIDFQSDKHAEDILFSLKCNLYANKISITTRITYHYRWERQLAKVTRKKIQDARNNVMQALLLVEKSGNPGLIEEMRKKTARTAYSTMVRANSVFTRRELYEHLAWWKSILVTMPDSIFNRLPRQISIFCKLIVSNRLEEALIYWQRKQLFEKVSNMRLVRLVSRLKNMLIPNPG